VRQVVRVLVVTVGVGVLTIASGVSAGATSTSKSSGCPKGTRSTEGACIETKLRPDPLAWRQANRFCLDKHRRLPELAELQTLFDATTADASTPEWYNLRYRAAGEELAGVVTGDGEVDSATATEPQVYRCVAVRP
jgi:hypothetical protein